MTTDPTTALPGRYHRVDQLAALLDALGDTPISDSERRSLESLCGGEAHVLEDLAALIGRARALSEPSPPACLWCRSSPASHRVLGDPVCVDCHRGHRTA